MTRPPLRVAIDVSPTLDPPLTGVGYRALYLIRAFLHQNAEHEIRLFGAPSRRAIDQPFPFHEGYESKSTPPFFRRLKLALWPRFGFPPIEYFTGKVDLAHGLFHDTPATRRAIKMVTIHDLSFFLYPDTHTSETVRVQTRLLKDCVKRADIFEVVSENCGQELVRLFDVPSERIRVVPGGINAEEFADLDQPSEVHACMESLGITAPYWIHLGTIEPRKNLVRLLEAYAAVRSQRRLPCLVLVGTKGWNWEPVFEARQRLGLNDSVFHAGYLSRRQALLLLRHATACLYPSIYEGFGLPVLEAMAAGSPVLTSEAGAIMEVSGGTCMHVDAFSVEAIANGMAALLDNEDEIRDRAEMARKRALEFTWAASATRLAHIYRSLA